MKLIEISKLLGREWEGKKRKVNDGKLKCINTFLISSTIKMLINSPFLSSQFSSDGFFSSFDGTVTLIKIQSVKIRGCCGYSQLYWHHKQHCSMFIVRVFVRKQASRTLHRLIWWAISITPFQPHNILFTFFLPDFVFPWIKLFFFWRKNVHCALNYTLNVLRSWLYWMIYMFCFKNENKSQDTQEPKVVIK